MWTLALPAVVFLATTSVVFAVAWWMQQKFIDSAKVSEAPLDEEFAPPNTLSRQETPKQTRVPSFAEEEHEEAFSTKPQPVQSPWSQPPDLSVQALDSLNSNVLEDPDEAFSGDAEDFDCGISQAGQFANFMQDDKPRRKPAPSPRERSQADQLEEGSMDAASFGSLFSAIDDDPSR